MSKSKKEKNPNLLMLSLMLVLSGIVVTMTIITKPVSTNSNAAPRTNINYSIIINQPDPHYLGDTVNFTTTSGKNLKIAVACYQGGVGSMVWSAEQTAGTSFLLGGTSSEWLTKGGDANCYAWLYLRKLSNGALAGTSFSVLGSR